MKKFVIENDFWSLFPNARIGVVVCHGIDNALKDLAETVQADLGGACTISILDINNKEVSIK
ncbi:hypothetical protein SDC9_126851 [bioreactor metagenome]|uniref:Uncharacterized protein n=1 Tax=bioreactor metagenome TaxID=1076179 RepID=A0A645CSC4_9ZZZZ